MDIFTAESAETAGIIRKIQDSKLKNVPGKDLAGFHIIPGVEYFQLFSNLEIICAFCASVRCLCRLI
jgi:hypothetical protein